MILTDDNGEKHEIDFKLINELRDYNYKMNCFKELDSFMQYLKTKEVFKGCKALNPSFKYGREYNVDVTGVTPLAVAYIESLEKQIQDLKEKQ